MLHKRIRVGRYAVGSQRMDVLESKENPGKDLVEMFSGQKKKDEGMTMAVIPKDPVMLLSYLNTQLRDAYPTLEELCSALDLNQTEVEEKLKMIDYHYDPNRNQFV